MNGLKVVLKLSKSVKQDSRPPEQPIAKPLKKRRRPEEDGAYPPQAAKPAPLQAPPAHSDEGGVVPKKRKFGLPPPVPQPVPAHEPSPAPARPFKPRLHIKGPWTLDANQKRQVTSGPSNSEQDHLRQRNAAEGHVAANTFKQEAEPSLLQDGERELQSLKQREREVRDAAKQAEKLTKQQQKERQREEKKQKSKERQTASKGGSSSRGKKRSSRQGSDTEGDSEATASEGEVDAPASRVSSGPSRVAPAPAAYAAAAVAASTANLPPKHADLQRVIERVQKKDTMEIFKEPVTEDVAPGYFTVISKPIDFTKIWAKLHNGEYTSWDLVHEDMTTMFSNAMTYNTPDTVYFKHARTLRGVADKLIELAREGITDFRGRTAGIVRAHNAQMAAEEKVDRDARRVAARNEKAAARAGKLAQRVAASGLPTSGLFPQAPAADGAAAPSAEPLESGAGGRAGDAGEGASSAATQAAAGKMLRGTARPMVKDTDGRRPLSFDENARVSYNPRCVDVNFMKLRALANGASAEGLSFLVTRQLPRQTMNQPLAADAYYTSLLRFAAGLKGRAQDIALARGAECRPPVAAPRPAAAAPAPQQQQPAVQAPSAPMQWQASAPGAPAAPPPAAAVTSPVQAGAAAPSRGALQPVPAPAPQQSSTAPQAAVAASPPSAPHTAAPPSLAAAAAPKPVVPPVALSAAAEPPSWDDIEFDDAAVSLMIGAMERQQQHAASPSPEPASIPRQQQQQHPSAVRSAITGGGLGTQPTPPAPAPSGEAPASSGLPPGHVGAGGLPNGLPAPEGLSRELWQGSGTTAVSTEGSQAPAGGTAHSEKLPASEPTTGGGWSGWQMGDADDMPAFGGDGGASMGHGPQGQLQVMS